MFLLDGTQSGADIMKAAEGLNDWCTWDIGEQTVIGFRRDI